MADITGVGLFTLNGDHEFDQNQITTDTLYEYIPYVSGTVYYYDEDTAQFSTIGSGDQYSQVSSNVNVIDETEENCYDVEAKIRTIEIMQSIFDRISSFYLFMRFGIARQILVDGTETRGTLRIFESNSNITKNESSANQLTLYEDDRDVNNVSTDTYSRMNGTRNFVVAQLPAGSRETKSVSYQIELTNEGRIFDFAVAQSMRNERGGNG